MFYDDHKTVLMNGWIICRFVEISEVSGDFLLDFALNMFLEKFTQLFHPCCCHGFTAKVVANKESKQ